MNIVIYARYSSHSQTEQSIEGQLQTCYEFAKNNGHIVIGEYIDRAQSGTTDSRAEFQRMIADSDKHIFEGVLVYQLDRFARNRYDSAINKAKLKKNGVRVISARENISDDASGILVEGVLESMAEYYSAELSQKIRRGMDINAEKCLSNGSNPGLGYYVDEERRFHVDPDGAAVVREIFEMYASGKTVAEITKYLNAKQVKTSQGKEFNKNSLHRLLRNKRYIGYYIYKDTETPGGMPRIIENELFERVQHILDRNKKAPARSRGREEYLLTTKLFCGYCREMMTGYGGTGKSGTAYRYYACKSAKKKTCRKKVVNKQKIEDRVVLECRKLLTDSNIEKIALAVAAACEANYDSSAIKRIKAAIQEADAAIENLWKALERGQAVDMIAERIEKRKQEKNELQSQLAIEMGKQVTFTAPQVKAFLYSLKRGNVNDENNRRGMVNIFLRAIYLYDDRMTLILNGGDRPITIDDILLDEIEEHFEVAVSSHAECSPLVAAAPPKTPAFYKAGVFCCPENMRLNHLLLFQKTDILPEEMQDMVLSLQPGDDRRRVALGRRLHGQVGGNHRMPPGGKPAVDQLVQGRLHKGGGQLTAQIVQNQQVAGQIPPCVVPRGLHPLQIPLELAVFKLSKYTDRRVIHHRPPLLGHGPGDAGGQKRLAQTGGAAQK